MATEVSLTIGLVSFVWLASSAELFYILDPHPESLVVDVGATTRLSCQSNQNFDICRWKHKDTGKCQSLTHSSIHALLDQDLQNITQVTSIFQKQFVLRQ